MRPLLDDESGDPSAVTRDYLLELDADGGAPLLSVWGGKITTFRKLAEEAADLLAPTLTDVTLRGAWTAGAPLPGRRPARVARRRRATAGRGRRDLRALRRGARARAIPTSPPALVRRLARRYGTRAARAPRRAGSASRSRPACSQAELEHLHAHEWARSGDDVLWRRTKLGLHLDATGRAAVTAWMAARQDANAERSNAPLV